MPENAANWYLVKTKPLSESRVSSRLSGAGFEVVFPLIRKSARRGASPIRPLFPTYLFVRLPVEQLRLVRYTHGVARIVSFGPDPQPVGEEIVEAVRARMDEDGIVRLLRRPAEWKAGQAVTVGEGPFTGLSAVFVEELPDRERVVLLLDAVSSYRVVIPKDSLER